MLVFCFGPDSHFIEFPFYREDTVGEEVDRAGSLQILLLDNETKTQIAG